MQNDNIEPVIITAAIQSNYYGEKNIKIAGYRLYLQGIPRTNTGKYGRHY